jgi:hypothetical protein
MKLSTSSPARAQITNGAASTAINITAIHKAVQSITSPTKLLDVFSESLQLSLKIASPGAETLPTTTTILQIFHS